MYQLLRRPEGRPWARPSDWLSLATSELLPKERKLVLHMCENRSTLGEHECRTFATLGACFALLSVLPALKGYWLVPVFSLGVLAMLVFALDRHCRSAPVAEMLELGEGRIAHRHSRRGAVELLPLRARLAACHGGTANLRLFICDRERSVEIGSCLSLAERQDIAPLVASALADARRSWP